MSVLNKLSDLRFMRGVIFGLDRIDVMAKLLNVPHKSTKIIHVAGTNGKGSVVTKLSYYLRHFGYCTGTFLSPHVNTFRERIIVDGKMITEEESIPLLEEIFTVSENNHIEVTYFENTDYAVIEVGLGGKNDATNIILPEISVITSVSLDHTKILGSTVEEICKEKAGIIKDNRPVVCGPHCPIDLLSSISKKHNALFYPVSIKEDCSYDEENIRICKKCIELLYEKLKINEDIDRILSIRPSCRFEWITSLVSPSFFPSKMNKDKSIEILCDACHNPHAFEYMIHDLLKYDLKENKDIIYHIIVGMCFDKDCKNNLKEILKMKNLKNIIFTKSQNERSASPQYLLEQFKDIVSSSDYDHSSSIPNTVVSKDVVNSIDCIKSIISNNTDKNQVIVICGSFFVMSEARKCLGIVEETDLVDMNEIWNKKC